MLRRPHSSQSRGRFPLPDDFFPAVVCTPAEIDALRTKAQRHVDGMFATMTWEMRNEDVSQGWKLSSATKHSRDSGVRTYCRRIVMRHDRQTRRMEFKCMGHTNMALDHVLDAFYCDTTNEYKATMARLLKGCLDARVLRVIDRRSETKPYEYLGLNWVAMRSPGILTRKRDFCVLQNTGVTQDASGERVGFLFVRSTNVPECGSLKHSHGVVRTSISALALFREDRIRRRTQVVLQGTIKMGSSSSRSIVTLIHDVFAACLTNLNSSAVMQRVGCNPAHALAAASPGDKKSCYTCGQRLAMFRRRRCGLCNQIMCRRCEFHHHASPLELNFAHRVPRLVVNSKSRFCKTCVMAAGEEQQLQQQEPVPVPCEPLKPEPLAPHSPHVPVYVPESPRSAQRDDSFDHCSIVSSNAGSIIWQWQGSVTPSSSQFSPRSFVDPASRAPRSSSVASASLYCASPTAQSWDAGSVLSETFEPPLSPLSIGVAQEWHTTSMPSQTWDGRSQASSSDAPPRFSSMPSPASRLRASDARESDLAARLFEMSCKAQDALDAVKRNSILMGSSDTSSQPRSSDVTFQSINESIAEQADLLNMMGLVTRGRVYMDTPDDECGGVRISQSSSGISEEERFEMLA